MKRERGGHLGRPVAVPAFEASSHSPMRIDPARGRKSLIKDLLVKRVLERVAARDRAVWPFGHAGRDYHAARPRQFLANLLDFQDVAIQRPCHQESRELRARRARDFEQASPVDAQIIDLPRDHLPQIARHGVLRNRFLRF